MVHLEKSWGFNGKWVVKTSGHSISDNLLLFSWTLLGLLHLTEGLPWNLWIIGNLYLWGFYSWQWERDRNLFVSSLVQNVLLVLIGFTHRITEFWNQMTSLRFRFDSTLSFCRWKHCGQREQAISLRPHWVMMGTQDSCLPDWSLSIPPFHQGGPRPKSGLILL